MSDDQNPEQLADRALDARQYAVQLASALTLKEALHPRSDDDWAAFGTAMIDALKAAWDFISAVSDVEKRRAGNVSSGTTESAIEQDDPAVPIEVTALRAENAALRQVVQALAADSLSIGEVAEVQRQARALFGENTERS